MELQLHQLQQRIRLLIGFFMTCLILSGLTAFPLQSELQFLNEVKGTFFEPDNPFYVWIEKVYSGLLITYKNYPFMAYGTDWLAFAHIVIAVAFVGPLRDPVKNIWIIQFGIIACIMIFPVAFIAGAIRGIPFYWQIIDCSFGAIGLIPLIICHQYIKKIENLKISITSK